MRASVSLALHCMLIGGLAACGASSDGAGESAESTASEPMSFEEFVSKTYKEPWEGGVYIYNGDTPVASLDELKKIYEKTFTSQQPLTVNRANNTYDVWDGTQRQNISYCIGNGFGGNKQAVINAMASATAAWESYAQIHFVYRSDQDPACNNGNGNVVFDVNPVAGQPYLARAFFPYQARNTRNIYIDNTAFSSSWPLYGILMHEVGHAIGFRHEHTRPEAGRCFEDSNWFALNNYDRDSVMHYPQCGGTNTQLNRLSARDADGVSWIYGARNIGRPPAPPSCGAIQPGYGLNAGEGIRSCDGRFLFVLQGDGNLVLYHGNSAIWVAPGTYGESSYGLYMQGDGNLVVYSGTPRALWNSGTHGYNGAYLAVQDDGNVVIYHNGVAVWNTQTGGR